VNEAIAIKPEFIMDEQGKPRSVLLSIKDYEALLELLEDVRDSIVFDAAFESSEGLRELEDAVADMRKDGLL